MREYEINQRIYQLTESINMRDVNPDGTLGLYTITGDDRTTLIHQYATVLMLPVETDLQSINMRVNSLLNGLRMTQTDADGKNQYIFTGDVRETIAGHLVKVLMIETT